MVVNETIQWTKESMQPMIFLKLDYQKAYDTIDLNFLIKIMAKMDMDEKFITMVRSLMRGVRALVLVNGIQTKQFAIKRGVN